MLQGTYYGEGREGTCTYDQTDFPAVGLSNQIHALAALNYIKWYNSKACGMCFRVSSLWHFLYELKWLLSPLVLLLLFCFFFRWKYRHNHCGYILALLFFYLCYFPYHQSL